MGRRTLLTGAAGLLGGPKSMSINSTRADLSMSDARLVVSTHHGRVLELTRDQPGSVRCTGPRRLVIEGARQRADGPMSVRAELIVDAPEPVSPDDSTPDEPPAGRPALRLVK